MVLVVDPHSGVPVYRQVMGQVKFLIAGGMLSPGDELPSPGALSSQLGVNPSTVSKAYGRLAGQGIIQRRYGRPVVLRMPEGERASGSAQPLPRHCAQSDKVRGRLGAANAEAAKVFSDPLVQQCLEQFANIRHRAIEQDLEKASQVQEVLLPPQYLHSPGWSAAYYYDAFGPTSGDYCDIIVADSGNVYFMLADVMGKGLAASLLMAHLHASFRALIPAELPVQKLVERVSSIFRDSTPDSFFATLVCGCAQPSGAVKICNAGHPPPVLVGAAGALEIRGTGLPIGLFDNQTFSAFDAELNDGDTIVVYSDGVSEAQSESGEEYGPERLARCVRANHRLAPGDLVAACVADVETFRAEAGQMDDLTILAVNREAVTGPANTRRAASC